MQPLPPQDLKCDYLRNPLCLQTSAPAFSWTLQHPRRGAGAAAYQVIVSPDRSFLEKEVGDYWDSGKVESDRTSAVVYKGEPLWSGKRYYWRVRWWDEKGNVSAWSETAFFEMGLLHQRDWKAKWISKREVREFLSKGNVLQGEYSGEFRQCHALYLRKEFKTNAKIRRAQAHVCGLGYSEFRLNGQKVGEEVLHPAQTDYKKIALYTVYDITGMLEEKNAAAIILGNGRHIANYGYPPPRAILQIEIEDEKGDSQRIISDETWKVSYGPISENGIYYGETYDARAEMPGWDEAGFDDTLWENAWVTEGPPLSGHSLQPIRVSARLNPTRMWTSEKGIYIFDFGQNFSGWVRLRVRGTRGTEIRLRHAELINRDGSLNVSPNQNADATDIFVCAGGKEEVYEPRFTYHGFRYVEVLGFENEPALEDIEGCFVHTDVEQAGEFGCSHDLINRIHSNILWGQLSNLMSIPTDCPQRDERQGWLGDAHLSAEEAMLNFDLAAFTVKFLEDIRLAQKADGSLPDVVPPYLSKLYPADPAWSAAYIELAWLIYFYCDDTNILQKHYGPMKRYVEFLKKNAEGHIIQKLGKYGDWCPPGSIVPKRTPLELTSTWYYYRAVVLLSEFAGILNRSDDARAYRKLALDIKEAFNAKFLGENQYAAHRIGPSDKSPNQTSNLLPLYLNMVPEEKKEKVLMSLLSSVIDDWDYHLDTGIIGTRYLLEVLSEHGYEEIAYRIATQESYPGWGYMIREGATTLWERWEKITGGGMNSHNHIMLGSVDAWFYRTIAGLKCRKSGWREIAVRPPLFPSLRQASAKVKTVRGKASVSWQWNEREFSVDMTIPVGSSAEIYIPILWDKTAIKEGEGIVWKTGQPFEPSPLISFLRGEGQYAVFKIGSGTYNFLSLPAANLS